MARTPVEASSLSWARRYFNGSGPWPGNITLNSLLVGFSQPPVQPLLGVSRDWPSWAAALSAAPIHRFDEPSPTGEPARSTKVPGTSPPPLPTFPFRLFPLAPILL